MDIYPHDLLWVSQDDAIVIDGELPEWFTRQGIANYPVVVRRELLPENWIPVGIRGENRSQRLAAKVRYSDLIACLAPEDIVSRTISNMERFSGLPAITALNSLVAKDLPYVWGVTGSTGYQLATGIEVMSEHSDLDLLFRCRNPLSFDHFKDLSQILGELPCRADAQIETPNGGFALNEWVRDKKVMLKTSCGPIITTDPWQLEANE